MTQNNKLNHYYPASSIASTYSTNPIDPLRESKINAINIFEVFQLIKKYKEKNQNLGFYDFCMSQKKKKFLCSPICEEILTDKSLIEDGEQDKLAQDIERKFLKYLDKGSNNSVYSTHISYLLSSEQTSLIKQEFIDFFNLSINRSPLYTYAIKTGTPNIGKNDIILNLCKGDNNELHNQNLFSDLIPIVPLQLSSLYLLFKEHFDWNEEELMVLEKNPLWIFNYSPTYFFLIFPYNEEVCNLLYPNKIDLNSGFIDKITELYAQIIFIYTFRYIIYHPNYSDIIKYVLEYYYNLYDETIEFRQRFGISNFTKILHLKKEKL